MAGITLAQAETQLALWLAADEAVAKGQAYTIGSRSLTRADAKTISEKIDFWESRVERLSSGGRGGARVRYGLVER